MRIVGIACKKKALLIIEQLKLEHAAKWPPCRVLNPKPVPLLIFVGAE